MQQAVYRFTKTNPCTPVNRCQVLLFLSALPSPLGLYFKILKLPVKDYYEPYILKGPSFNWNIHKEMFLEHGLKQYFSYIFKDYGAYI